MHPVPVKAGVGNRCCRTSRLVEEAKQQLADLEVGVTADSEVRATVSRHRGWAADHRAALIFQIGRSNVPIPCKRVET
jgi:hypothetical protein